MRKRSHLIAYCKGLGIGPTYMGHAWNGLLVSLVPFFWCRENNFLLTGKFCYIIGLARCARYLSKAARHTDAHMITTPVSSTIDGSPLVSSIWKAWQSLRPFLSFHPLQHSQEIMLLSLWWSPRLSSTGVPFGQIFKETLKLSKRGVLTPADVWDYELND